VSSSLEALASIFSISNYLQRYFDVKAKGDVWSQASRGAA
jgi:hypothetical protein